VVSLGTAMNALTTFALTLLLVSTQGSQPQAAPQGSQAAPPSASQAAPPINQAAPPAVQKPAPARPGQKPATPPATPVPAPPPPPGYVIGPDDVLGVVFRYDRDMTADVTVRPDGMISLPMLNDIQAAGLTPEELRNRVTERAKQFISDPAVTVIVRTINSRKVFITGEVTRPGPYALTAPTTVIQLIAMAGGLTEFANKGKITIMRMENGRPVSYPFNYKDVMNRKNLKQNIELKPGDTVIVP